ncbi:hypothetical protein DSO57_1006845 [Entomophthora muscae]|uniref:Uncharacterized protein n=1 Tax=Entomophthora muscae TaxID=34485 RepID=A0ACC2SKX4_9FUNG|nr:hypothetical protein DSO57_1006845 [Entomophthora muscae]
MSYIVYTGLAIVAAVAYYGYQAYKVPKELEHLPVVSFVKYLAATVAGESFEKKFERLYCDIMKKGLGARMWTQGRWEVHITDWAQTKDILYRTDDFLKREDSDINSSMLFTKYFGKSNIIFSDGDVWRRHRRVANPAFKKTWSTEMLQGCADELIQHLEERSGETIDVQLVLERLALDVLGRAMFSYDFEAVKKGESSKYLSLYLDLAVSMFNPAYIFMPVLERLIPSRKIVHDKNDEFRDFLKGIIQKGRSDIEAGIERDDLLSLMIHASIDDCTLTDEEVVNDLAAFFFAGHDTTANTLATIIYFLSLHPEMQAKARNEVKSVLNLPPSEQIKNMPYLNCIMRESMRIITTVPVLHRYCPKTTTLPGNLVIPGGNFVSIQSWALNHDPNVFPDPYTFNPERFADPQGIQAQKAMAFGGGSRMCIGLNFSLIVQRVIMSSLLQKFEFRRGPNCGQADFPTLSTAGLIYPINTDIEFIKLNAS